MGNDREANQAARRAELGAFLRAQRARLRPADVGLPEDIEPGRRRTPGLRREEVAQLSGVGVTWYTWLEQGRDIRASAQVVDALARTFLLTPDARRHLRDLAGLPAVQAAGRTTPGSPRSRLTTPRPGGSPSRCSSSGRPNTPIS
jgi:transcriptional regulator with XRE-family HTH domain